LSSAQAQARTVDGWIIDVSGNRRRGRAGRSSTANGATEVYTVYSLEVVDIPVNTTFRFIVDQSAYLNCPTIIEPGANDLSQGIFATDGTFTPAQIMEDVRRNQDAMVATLTSLCPAYVVTGFFNFRSSITQAGNDADLAIIAHNDIQRAKYGWRFCDLQAIFMSAATSSTADQADLAKHWPTAAVVDPNSNNAGTGQTGSTNIVHPTDYGHALMANGNAGFKGTIAILQSQLLALPQ
jgi:hypothetical protein